MFSPMDLPKPPVRTRGPIGTMSPTARAFQLFSNVAVNGESVLTATIAGDTTNVRAYAATNSGGTALVLFNLNENANAPVTITLSGLSSASTVSVETYDKAIYDMSNPATTNTWAPPVTTNLGAQTTAADFVAGAVEHERGVDPLSVWR